MQRNYRKIMVEMERESDVWNFKDGPTSKPVCYVESYKDKRAVFFQGNNLLQGVNYHLVLIGSVQGNVLHRNFGPFRVHKGGELQCYKVFHGETLENYEFCLICVERENGQMDIVYKGRLFFHEDNLWESLCGQANLFQAFSREADETKAQWYRRTDFEKLPAWTENCHPWAKAYGHYIIGRKESRYFLGVPGRFLQKEQPLRDEGVFLLWQPIRGGEDFYDCPENMSRREQEDIFGYWIAEIDINKEKFRAV